MKIDNNPTKDFCGLHFVYLEDDIILQKKFYKEYQFTFDSFLTEEQMKELLNGQVVSDWYSEKQYDYTAFYLEKDCPLKKDFIRVPVREIFWDCQSDEKLVALIARGLSLLKQRETLRYCPTCGGKLVTDNEFVAKKCSICQRQFFPRIEPAIIVLVKKGEKILLVKAKNRKREVFSCISGYVEAGENLEQCVVREVKEETGITVKNVQYVSSQYWPYPDQLMMAFTAEYQEGKIQVQEEELFDAQWCNIYSLPEIPRKGSVAYNLITKYSKK